MARMWKWLIGIGALVLLAVIVGLFIPAETGEPVPVTVEHAVADTGIEMEVVQTGPLVTGGPAPLAVRLRENGASLKLASDPGVSRVIHMTFASADLADHQHEYFFQESSDGRYPIAPPVTAVGPYRLWVEVNDVTTSDHHREEALFRAYADLVAAAPTAPVVTPEPTPAAYTVTLEHDALRAGVPAVLEARVETAAGEAVPLLPVDSFYSLVGEGADWQLLAHVDRVTEDQARSLFTVTFPAPGRYSVWTEHYIETDGSSIVRDQFLVDVQ